MILNDDFYGDRFRWFIGVVQDIADDRSRVRVRIFGIHHIEDTLRVPNDILPWAMVLYPTTGGQTSSGNVSHGLKVGTWVFGMFVDGEDSQQPIVMGVINGGPGSINNSPAGSGTRNDSREVSSPGNNIPTDTNTTPTTQLTGGSNAQKVYNYFWEKISKEGSASGDIKLMCAAIVGNFQIESASDNINPQAYNPNDEGEISIGIAQWRTGKYDRATPMLKFCGISGLVKPPNLPPLEQQLDYVWHEFHVSEREAYKKLLVATTIQDATAAIICYERDDSYKQISNKVWAVDRESPFYQKKLVKARAALSSFSYTGNFV
jgi:Phage tail lysozyme